MAPPASRPLSLLQRGSLVILAAVLVGFGVQWLAQDQAIRQQVRKDLTADLSAAVARNGEQLGEVIESTRRDLRLLMASPPVARLVARPGQPSGGLNEADRPALTQLFLALLQNRPDYDQVRLIAAAAPGRELIRADQAPGGPAVTPASDLQAKGDRDYHRAALALRPGAVYTSNIDLNRERGQLETPHKPTLRVATPLVGPDGKPLGVLVINRNMGRTLGLLAQGTHQGQSATLPGEQQMVFLANGNGDFLVHPTAGYSFGFDLGLPHRWQDELGPLPTAGPGAPHPLVSVDTELGPLHLAASRVELDPAQPDRALTLAYAVTDVRVDSLVTAARRSQLLGEAGEILVLLLLLGLGLRHLVRPLRNLTAAADDASAGRYEAANARIGALPAEQSGLELEALKQAFRRMLGEVQEREQRVGRLNAELLARETEARLVFDASPEGALLVGPDGHIVRANRRACALFGYTAGGLDGLAVEALMPETLRANHATQRQTYLQAPSERLMGSGRELRGRRRDGSEFPAELSLAPVRYQDRMHVIVGAIDISARKAAEAEIHRLNAELEQRVIERTTELQAANQELEAFTYAVAHDLRAPLRAMSGFAAALQEDHRERFDGDAAECLAEIVEGSRRMADLIDGLLALSRATQGTLDRQPVDLTTLARRIAGELQRAEPRRQVRWEIAEGLSTRGEPRMVEIVLYNLLGNAWKYTAHEPEAVIRFGTTEEDGLRHFCIEDNGAGFDMRHAEKLFTPFQRLHRRDEFPGIGIGLATVQRIIRRHGGHIKAHGAPGRGAHFCFTIENPANHPVGGEDE